MPPEEKPRLEQLVEEIAEARDKRLESQRQERRQSRSPEHPEDDDEIEGSVLCRDLDPFHDLRKALTILGFERGEYSGIPVPIQGNKLVVAPGYSFTKAYHEQINDITMRELRENRKVDPEWEHLEIVNEFWSGRWRCDVLVVRDKRTGKSRHRLRPQANHVDELLGTLHASDVWGVDQEQAALQTLGGMLKHRQFKQYLLTGMFLEKSPRSHIPYLFRRLRPTVALSSIPPSQENDWNSTPTILCCLCMHPIAYYSGTWAGAMTPTDDVIAHLALMRGDEAMFWRRCNQHGPWRPQAGV